MNERHAGHYVEASGYTSRGQVLQIDAIFNRYLNS